MRTDPAFFARTRKAAWKASSASWWWCRTRRQTPRIIGPCLATRAAKAASSRPSRKRRSSSSSDSSLAGIRSPRSNAPSRTPAMVPPPVAVWPSIRREHGVGHRRRTILRPRDPGRRTGRPRGRGTMSPLSHKRPAPDADGRTVSGTRKKPTRRIRKPALGSLARARSAPSSSCGPDLCNPPGTSPATGTPPSPTSSPPPAGPGPPPMLPDGDAGVTGIASSPAGPRCRIRGRVGTPPAQGRLIAGPAGYRTRPRPLLPPGVRASAVALGAASPGPRPAEQRTTP